MFRSIHSPSADSRSVAPATLAEVRASMDRDLIYKVDFGGEEGVSEPSFFVGKNYYRFELDFDNVSASSVSGNFQPGIRLAFDGAVFTGTYTSTYYSLWNPPQGGSSASAGAILIAEQAINPTDPFFGIAFIYPNAFPVASSGFGGFVEGRSWRRANSAGKTQFFGGLPKSVTDTHTALTGFDLTGWSSTHPLGGGTLRIWGHKEPVTP